MTLPSGVKLLGYGLKRSSSSWEWSVKAGRTRLHLVSVTSPVVRPELQAHIPVPVLDKKPMFTVFSADRKDKDDKPFAHHVKALQIIWNLFPQ